MHFTNCKGDIEITNSFLSSANDDAINVHGTYLRIVKKISKRKIIVRYMHPQTYGFNTFFTGDSVEFVSAKNLLPYSNNIIKNAELLNEKEIELTFQKDIPMNIAPNDVIENITWMPDVRIANTKITKIPTRGILVTTRGKVIIENNEIIKTNMSGILIADDANSWFESGYVRNVSIKNNKFIFCGEPVVNIYPENSSSSNKAPVHKNIIITNNQFNLKNNLALFAKSTNNIKFTNNLIISLKKHRIENYLKLKNCNNVKIKNNLIHN